MLHDYSSKAKDLFLHAPRFSAVLRDHANMAVVVSSNWRKSAGGLAELVTHFVIDVCHRFVGLTGITATPYSHACANESTGNGCATMAESRALDCH